MQPLTIWTNVSYHDEAMNLLRRGVEAHQLVFSENPEYSNIATPAPDDNLPLAEIVFGQADPKRLIESPKLKWAHLSSAGYTNFDRDDLRTNFKRRGVRLINSSSVYAEPCVQHLVTLTLAAARKIRCAVANQIQNHAWLCREIREHSVLLNSQKVLLVGFGVIVSASPTCLGHSERELRPCVGHRPTTKASSATRSMNSTIFSPRPITS